jgi:hypothetical protein
VVEILSQLGRELFLWGCESSELSLGFAIVHITYFSSGISRGLEVSGEPGSLVVHIVEMLLL